MLKLLRYIVLVAIITGACPLATTAQVLVRATVDRDSLLIGEPITLLLDVRTPLGQRITWFNFDTIPHFEFIEKGSVDTTDGIDGKAIQQAITITSFDSGYWAIPPLAIKIGDKTYYTDSVPVKVAWAAFDPAEDYRDIKNIEEVPPPAWLRYLPWIIGGAVVLAAAGMVYLLRRRKLPAPVQQEAVPLLSHYQEAMQALDELRENGYLQNGQIKTYYSRLNDILRVYVWKQWQIATMEKTNDELILQLRDLFPERDNFSSLVSALRVADFVKFAKYQPDTNEHEKNLNIVRTAISSLQRTYENMIAAESESVTANNDRSTVNR